MNSKIKRERRDEAAVFINFNVPITQSNANQLMHVVNEMVNVKRRKLVILLSSTNGDPRAAFSAYNFLTGIVGIQIVTHNMGMVSNNALPLFCVGQMRTCAPNAVFQFEDPLEVSLGGIMREYDFVEMLKLMRVIRLECEKIIAHTVGRTEEEIHELMVQNYFMQAGEAIKFKLAQRIEEKLMQAGDIVINIENK